MTEHFEQLSTILSRALKVPKEAVHPESRLVEDLKADSLDASVAIMDIEDQFGIQVPDNARTYKTVQDILNHIEELLKAKGAAAANPQTAQSVSVN